MSIVEAAVDELRRLGSSGHAAFSDHPDSDDLPRYVSGLIVPPLETALRDISTRNLPSHLIEAPNRQSMTGELPDSISVVHYTSVQTTFALLQGDPSGDHDSYLRLYDSEHTNDPEEGTHFFNALNLPPQHHWITTPEPSHAYLASFFIPSKKKDSSNDLTFWRFYGRDGKGCSLQVWVPTSLLNQVAYVCTVDDGLRDDLLSIFDALTQITELSIAVQNILRSVVWKELGSLRFLYKDTAYSDEQECRIVIPKDDVNESDIQFDFKSEPESLRRFIAHSHLSTSRIFGSSGSSITIGPAAAYKDDLEYSLNLMRRRAGLEHTLQIRTSQIPYRSET